MAEKTRNIRKLVKIEITKEERDKDMALKSAVAFFVVIIMLVWGVGFKKTLATNDGNNSMPINLSETSEEFSEIFSKSSNNFKKIRSEN